MKTKVLCTFAATYGGGILRVMSDGLPHLNRCPEIDLTFGDLYEREEIKASFRDAGLSVRDIGLSSPPYTSIRRGLGRYIDRFSAIPRYGRIAYRLRRAARGMDVVYVHTYKELVLSALSGARVVWHCHGLDSVPPFTARLARSCVRVIAISDSVAETLLGVGIPRERIVTVLNAVDLDRIRNEAGVANPNLPPRGTSPVVLLPTASIRSHKGIHVLLEAAKAVPDLLVWIAGDMSDSTVTEYSASLLALSRSPQLTGRVSFIGFRPDIFSVMRAADFVCVPSVYREGFGLAAAEAMTLGKPVIVSNRGGLPEVVEDGRSGIIIDPDKPRDLAGALKKLAADPHYARNLGEHAAASANRRFSYRRWAEGVARVLRDSADAQ